ncbi:dihydrodipicolinate synthase family protein [Shewanella kaireitica]|uniref:dihydrodipicolinate synthase family protein n=1 Tax=Shewanella kaireitica TaxID=212021 RepID=UPI00200C3C9B|nr:dihydrodipicolinate synthase family protein [Shewanella kaireitica]MCL1094930.1 dihydrodipicolinate synthase family protein [Shewanella kaireitica]
MKVNWQGVFPAISTQFNEGATINYESNARMLEELIRDGIDGIVALGTIGENASLGPEEKHNFIKHTVETFKGRILVLSGCTENTTEQILGRGSENVHMPRLPLIGEEWTYVEQVIAQALETRIDPDKYNID